MRTIAAFLLWFCVSTQAATTYFCDCSTGAHASCVAGNNANAGTLSSAPKQTISAANTAIQSTGAGDQFLFCKGGAWPAGGNLDWTNATSTATASNPIIFDGYTPSWGGTARPILRFTGQGFYLSSYNTHNGVAIRNLDLRGPDTVAGNSGMFVYANVNYVIVDNVNFQGFHVGTENNTLSKNLIIKNSQYVNNRNLGAWIVSDNILFENNTLTNNGGCAGGTGCYVPAQRHSVYVGGGTNITIRGNTMTQSAYEAGACAGTALTGHGNVSGMIWENNLVHETSATGGCYGIGYGDTYGATNEGTSGFIVRGNVVANVGNNYFIFNASPGIIIENNIAVNTGVSNGGSGDAFTVEHKNNVGALNTSTNTIRNNSAYYASGTSGNAIRFDNTSYGTGAGHIVANNLINIALGSTAGCWTVNGKPASDFTAWNYNICYNAGSGSSGGSNTPFTGAQANGITASPNLRNVPSSGNSWDMCVNAGSNAINAGTATYASRLAYKGYKPVGARDIGACEYGSNP